MLNSCSLPLRQKAWSPLCTSASHCTDVLGQNLLHTKYFSSPQKMGKRKAKPKWSKKVPLHSLCSHSALIVLSLSFQFARTLYKFRSYTATNQLTLCSHSTFTLPLSPSAFPILLSHFCRACFSPYSSLCRFPLPLVLPCSHCAALFFVFLVSFYRCYYCTMLCPSLAAQAVTGWQKYTHSIRT
jgi:hypothetical protein